jgi:hypothetical protein
MILDMEAHRQNTNWNAPKGVFSWSVGNHDIFSGPERKLFKPTMLGKREERTAEEAERFLKILVDDLNIGEIGNLKPPVLLHPTFYDFDIIYADGHVHRFEYVIEAGNHLDERCRRLVEECERFFKRK